MLPWLSLPVTVFHFYDNSLRVNFIYLFTYLVLAVLGLHCSVNFTLVVASQGCSLIVVLRPLTVVASPLRSMDCRISGISSCSTWAQPVDGVRPVAAPGAPGPGLPGVGLLGNAAQSGWYENYITLSCFKIPKSMRGRNVPSRALSLETVVYTYSIHRLDLPMTSWFSWRV